VELLHVGGATLLPVSNELHQRIHRHGHGVQTLRGVPTRLSLLLLQIAEAMLCRKSSGRG
jgi:hypothetical protein